MFKNLIPKIFYDHLEDGLEFFVAGRGFEVLYQDAVMAVVARDGAKAYIVLRHLPPVACRALRRPETRARYVGDNDLGCPFRRAFLR